MITLLKRLKRGLSRRISLLSTIRPDVWLHYKRRVWLHRKTNFIARGATIRVGEGGLFQIGMPQSGELFYASEFYMLPGAVCTVQNNFRLSSGTRLRMNRNAHLSVGSCFVNHGGMIDCTCSIRIGNGVVMGQYVSILDSDGHVLSCDGQEVEMMKPIVIKDHVWICQYAKVLKGVTIGEGAIVAAGSVVTKDVPPRCLVAGIPARVIRENVVWGEPDWDQVATEAARYNNVN